MINEPMIILITLIISYFILQPVFIFFVISILFLTQRLLCHSLVRSELYSSV